MSLKPDNSKKVSLINPEFILELSEVFYKGAQKYKELDYLTSDRSNIISAAYRHLLKYQAGEKYDLDSLKEHLLHVAANVMILYTLDKMNEKNSLTNSWLNSSNVRTK